MKRFDDVKEMNYTQSWRQGCVLKKGHISLTVLLHHELKLHIIDNNVVEGWTYCADAKPLDI